MGGEERKGGKSSSAEALRESAGTSSPTAKLNNTMYLTDCHKPLRLIHCSSKSLLATSSKLHHSHHLEASWKSGKICVFIAAWNLLCQDITKIIFPKGQMNKRMGWISTLNLPHHKRKPLQARKTEISCFSTLFWYILAAKYATERLQLLNFPPWLAGESHGRQQRNDLPWASPDSLLSPVVWENLKKQPKSQGAMLCWLPPSQNGSAVQELWGSPAQNLHVNIAQKSC